MLPYDKVLMPVIRPTNQTDAAAFHNVLQGVVDTFNRTRSNAGMIDNALREGFDLSAVVFDPNADATSMAYEPTNEHKFRWTVMGSGGYFFEFRIHPNDRNSMDLEVFTPYQAVYSFDLFYNTARWDIKRAIDVMLCRSFDAHVVDARSWVIY